MSNATFVTMPSERSLAMGKEDWQALQADEQLLSSSSSPSSEAISLNYEAINEFAAQSWLPELPKPWVGMSSSQVDWYDEISTIPPQDQNVPAFYTSNNTQEPGASPLQFNTSNQFRSNPIPKDGNRFYQPCSQVIDPLGDFDQNGNHAQKHIPNIQHQAVYTPCSEPLPLRERPLFHAYEPEAYRPLPYSFQSCTPIVESNDQACCAAEEFETFESPKTSPTVLKLDWSTSENVFQCPPPRPSSNSSVSSTLPKRKLTPKEPTTKKARTAPAQQEISEFVVVFENAPGALASVKRRRKLDAPVRKAAKAVRKAGACHQCRFRKRTCSTGTPCNSCLRNGNGLHELKCQRESPFMGQTMHHYFAHSSTKRLLVFDVMIPTKLASKLQVGSVVIDGVGRISHQLELPVRTKNFGSFKPDERLKIMATTRTEGEDPQNDSVQITLLENNANLIVAIEQWALEYTDKFITAAGPKYLPTTIAHIMGTIYVQKNLPESPLVATMLRISSLAFVLRAGVKCTMPNKFTSQNSSTDFRTIQATIDTILYQRLCAAEKDLCHSLQRLIFRSAGYLTRTQLYPVALIFWQLLRMLCLASSHLHNISVRFPNLPPSSQQQAEHQFNDLRLMLSTHMALFRSSSPLLLNYEEKENKDLLGNDEELCGLAVKMRAVVERFREKGFPDLRGSIAYRKCYFDLFRRVYDRM